MLITLSISDWLTQTNTTTLSFTTNILPKQLYTTRVFLSSGPDNYRCQSTYSKIKVYLYIRILRM